METPTTLPAPEENTASTQDIEVKTSVLTESCEYKLEIIPPYSTIQCRRSDIIYRDGVEIARSYHRHTCVPGDDVSSECAEVQAVAAALWSEEVISAYQSTVFKPETMPSEEEEPEVSTADLESEV